MKVSFFIRRIRIQLLLAVYLLFSYNSFPWFWSAMAGFFLIILISYLEWGPDFFSRTGLPVKTNTITASLSLTGIIFFTSFYLIDSIAPANGIVLRFIGLRPFFHDLFYTLNEEIVLGGILLGSVRINFNKLPSWFISVSVALAFAIVHFVFFKWIFNDRGDLSFLTLSSLFLIGVVRNNMIMGTGHIGYSWAIHSGWVCVMLGFAHWSIETGKQLTDLQRFNLYLGNHLIISILLVITVFSFFILYKPFKFFKF